MNTKKRKPLGSAMEEFVFGTNETTSPTPPEIASPAATPAASLTPEAALPATPPQPEVSAPESLPIQSKESSLMSKLQAPDSRSDGQVYRGYVRNSAPQVVDVGS
jgi:hypothetical protein